MIIQYDPVIVQNIDHFPRETPWVFHSFGHFWREKGIFPLLWGGSQGHHPAISWNLGGTDTTFGSRFDLI
jgi:hypothetical protein